MSVPVHMRSENKLQALKDTLTMTSYTIKMCENEKIFPKKCRWTICNRIIDECLFAVKTIQVANKINPQNVEQAKYRLTLQWDVLASFTSLWALMTVAVETYNVPYDKVEIFSEYLLIAEETVTAWRNANKKTYKAKWQDLLD